MGLGVFWVYGCPLILYSELSLLLKNALQSSFVGEPNPKLLDWIRKMQSHSFLSSSPSSSLSHSSSLSYSSSISSSSSSSSSFSFPLSQSPLSSSSPLRQSLTRQWSDLSSERESLLLVSLFHVCTDEILSRLYVVVGSNQTVLAIYRLFHSLLVGASRSHWEFPSRIKRRMDDLFSRVVLLSSYDRAVSQQHHLSDNLIYEHTRRYWRLLLNRRTSLSLSPSPSPSTPSSLSSPSSPSSPSLQGNGDIEMGDERKKREEKGGEKERKFKEGLSLMMNLDVMITNVEALGLSVSSLSPERLRPTKLIRAGIVLQKLHKAVSKQLSPSSSQNDFSSNLSLSSHFSLSMHTLKDEIDELSREFFDLIPHTSEHVQNQMKRALAKPRAIAFFCGHQPDPSATKVGDERYFPLDNLKIIQEKQHLLLVLWSILLVLPLYVKTASSFSSPFNIMEGPSDVRSSRIKHLHSLLFSPSQPLSHFKKITSEIGLPQIYPLDSPKTRSIIETYVEKTKWGRDYRVREVFCLDQRPIDWESSEGSLQQNCKLSRGERFSDRSDQGEQSCDESTVIDWKQWEERVADWYEQHLFKETEKWRNGDGQNDASDLSLGLKGEREERGKRGGREKEIEEGGKSTPDQSLNSASVTQDKLEDLLAHLKTHQNQMGEQQELYKSLQTLAEKMKDQLIENGESSSSSSSQSCNGTIEEEREEASEGRSGGRNTPKRRGSSMEHRMGRKRKKSSHQTSTNETHTEEEGLFVTREEQDPLVAHSNAHLLWFGSLTGASLAILHSKMSPILSGQHGLAFYFSDALSNFCYSSSFDQETSSGIMFLSDVELGLVTELQEPNPTLNFGGVLGMGGTSVLARGNLTPDPSGRKFIDSPNGRLSVPCGKMVRSGLLTSFPESHYAIYSPRQAILKYVVHLEWYSESSSQSSSSSPSPSDSSSPLPSSSSPLSHE